MSNERKLVWVGRLGRPHGIRGEIRLAEQDGSGAWREAERLYIGADEDALTAYPLLQIRGGGRFAILQLEGVVGRDEADKLKGLDVYVEREVLPEPEEGAFYVGDLLGLQVEDEQGRVLGLLKSIFDNGAHEVYEVVGPEGLVLLPVTEGLVLEVDLDAGRMVVAPPAGLPGL